MLVKQKDKPNIIPSKRLLKRLSDFTSKEFVYEHYKYKISISAQDHEEYQDMISTLIDRLEY